VRITEVKRHLDGRVERFPCELVHRERRVVMIRYRHERERIAGGYWLPAGGVTYGFVWPARSYVLYRFVGPDGGRIADRFDVVERAAATATEVRYTDLLLDVWVSPAGEVRIEDEEEVADCARRGLLTAAQLARIERTRALLLRRYRSVLAEADRLLHAAGIA
jgi:hypothetical protein